jgi:formate hydrogenlyase subunit 4/hydrogenase-4 membrane subunit HyfE
VPTLPSWAVQILQVLSVLALAPLVTGVIANAEAVVQQRRGPRVLQPYYDILKLLRKETVLPGSAGPFFRAAPYVSFAGYATVPLLIPVLTSFPLPLSYSGDILAGGLILGMAGFAISIAAIDSASPYAQLGSSRLRSFGALNEPTVIFVIFVVALITHTDLPYVLGATLRSSTVQVVQPSHLLILAAFFIVVLSETGRVPVESRGSTLEFGQIEEGRVSEHSGPGLAFLRWGSSVKQLVLYTIFANVLLVPWGLAGSGRLDDVLIAIALLFAKALAIGAAVVVIESSFAKLRLYKIPEFTAAGFLFAVLAVVIFLFQPSFGGAHLSVFGAAATITAVAVLLAEFGMLRSQEVWEQLSLYAAGSLFVAVLAVVTAATGHGTSSLYVLALTTVAVKAVLFPLGIRFLLRNLDVETRVPSVLGTASAVLVGVALCAFAFIALHGIHFGAEAALPLSALPVAVGGVLVAFLLMMMRPYAPSQLLGFLVLENAVSVAALVIAPGLPIILALLLLFDVLIGVVVFVVLVQYLAVGRTAVRTDILNRLTG